MTIKIKPVHMQLAYMKTRLEKLSRFDDSFTITYYYGKLVLMNKELKERVQEFEKCEKEKKR